MNYGQAIEAMKAGSTVRRGPGAYVYLAHRGTQLQCLEEVMAGVGRQPYEPTVDDQLANDWRSGQAPMNVAA